ncbi:MAG: restriction endonuclease subunit S [Cyanobacteria bacterium J06626_4]
MNLHLKPIGEFCKTGSGGTPSRKQESKYYNGSIPWVKSGELRETVILETEEKITEAALSETSAKMIPPGALLVAMYGATVGRIATLGIPASSNQAVCHIVPDEAVADQRYMFYALSKQVPKWLDQRVGGAQPNISQHIIRNTQIPLPPIEEQRRIAAILDKADAVRRKRKEAIALTEELLRSIFLDMFDDANGNDWEITTVENIAREQKGSIRTGPFGSQLLHSEFVDSGIAVLGIDNAVKNEFFWAKPRYITEDKYEELKRYKVHPGDVLITIMGTCGRCAIVPDDCSEAINTKHLCCITLDRRKCIPEFLHSYFLLHPKARLYLERNAKGAIMDGLNMGIIKKLPIPLPPVSLQEKFGYIHLKSYALSKKASRLETEENELFNSLLQRAFRGEL